MIDFPIRLRPVFQTPMAKYLSETVRTGNFDNLQAWGIYELSEPVGTMAGHILPAGTEFWFSHAVVTLKTRDALVHGSTPEGKHLVIQTRDYAHRRIFVSTGREWRPQQPPPPPPKTPAKNDPLPDLVRERANTPEARWLATQPQFKGAWEIIANKNSSSSDWGSARRDAGVLRFAARALQHTQPAVAGWLADWSLTFYHSWMSQATSGGEGTAMQNEIREELAEMRALAKLREG